MIDGKAKFSFNEPEAIKALNFWAQLLEDQIVGPAGGEAMSSFISGDVAMYFILDLTWIDYLEALDEMNDDFGIMFLPIGPQANEYVAPVRNFTMHGLPITAEEPEALIAIANALYKTTKDYRSEEEYIEEYTSIYTQYARDFETIEILKEMPQKVIFTRDRANMGLARPISNAIKNNEDILVKMDEIAPEKQANLDEFYTQ
jgi:ABC-type glycerol-3-phosphate transport system substrate-binding protein